MHIKEILSQHRRDMQVIYKCEHCGAERKGSGYDDDNFHENVIPAMKCEQCNRTADEKYKPMDTKYPAGMQV